MAKVSNHDQVALDILNKVEETPVEWPWVRRKAHLQALIIEALNAASNTTPTMADLFNKLTRRMQYDGRDIASITLGEMERAIEGAKLP